MLNAIPVIGWLISALVSVSLAVPFWLIWTVFGIGQTYAYWLPEVYQAPGFWACVGIFIVMGIIKTVFVPRLVTVSNTSSSGKD